MTPCPVNSDCKDTEGHFECHCKFGYYDKNDVYDPSRPTNIQCVFGEPPFSVSDLKAIDDYYVDICDFGVITINFTFNERFDRTVPSLCVTVYSSDEEAHTRPSIIENAKPSINYGVALHAEFTDEAFQAKERPYINVCPCDIDPVECKKSNIFIDIIDDECHGEAAMAAMEAATESDYSKRLDYVQTKMKFMFDNEESMAETSEMLVQNCYSRLKHAGIVSCKEKFNV